MKLPLRPGAERETRCAPAAPPLAERFVHIVTSADGLFSAAVNLGWVVIAERFYLEAEKLQSFPQQRQIGK